VKITRIDVDQKKVEFFKDMRKDILKSYEFHFKEWENDRSKINKLVDCINTLMEFDKKMYKNGFLHHIINQN
jgi:hypothetical protein